MMKSVITSFFLITTCVFVGHLNAQTKTFNQAKGSGGIGEIGQYSKWTFSTSLGEYELSDKGRLKKVKGASSNLIRKKAGLVTGVGTIEMDSDLLLLLEMSDAESGWGKMVRLNGTTLKVKWSAGISSFNVGGVVEDKFAYVVGMGFIGKINLTTGRYGWKHDDLYRKYKADGAFNIIETPEIKGDTIVFTEKQDREGKSPNTMIVNKATGKIVKVTLGR